MLEYLNNHVNLHRVLGAEKKQGLPDGCAGGIRVRPPPQLEAHRQQTQGMSLIHQMTIEKKEKTGDGPDAYLGRYPAFQIRQVRFSNSQVKELHKIHDLFVHSAYKICQNFWLS